MKTQQIPDWHARSLRAANEAAQQAQVDAMLAAHKASVQRKRQSVALPELFNVVVDTPVKPKSKVLPKRPVLSAAGNKNNPPITEPVKAPLDLTKDDLDILIYTNRVGFSQHRIVAEMLGRSEEAVRKRMNRLVAANYLEQVKGPYIVQIYRMTAEGMKWLPFDEQRPIRNFNVFDESYTRRCHIGGLIADIYGAGSNEAAFGPGMPDGRMAAIPGNVIVNALLQVKASGNLSAAHLHAAQHEFGLDPDFPRAAGKIPTATELLEFEPDITRFVMGSVKKNVQSVIYPRPYVFATLDSQGTWVPDLVIPMLMTSENRFSVYSGIVCVDFESKAVMRRNLRNLYITLGSVRSLVYCYSQAITEEYRSTLMEMEADGTLPPGASKYYSFLRLRSHNYTGKGEDVLTSSGAVRAITGFHG